MINVGLLGAGRIGMVHASSIARNPDSRIVAVADTHEPAAQQLAVRFGPDTRSIDAILADPSIDAVLVATSTGTHSDLVEAATAAGKAVLCEKPLDLSLERAKACQATAGKTGAPMPVGLADGVTALAIAEAATISARSGQTVELTDDMLS